jgi:hypothetical protein
MTSEEKKKYLWGQIALDQTKGAFMDSFQTLLTLANIDYLEDMGSSEFGDWRPASHDKITHGLGMHAQAHFVWQENNYTGLFQKADNCVIRVANAAAPGGITMGTYGPNMAVKCTRTNAPSANLALIYEIDGYDVHPQGKTKSCSYFEGPLVNHCARRDDIATPLQIFVSRFSDVDNRPMMLGVSQMAQYDQDGNDLRTKADWPFALIFQPNPLNNELKCNFSDVTSQLRQLYPGDTLYKVYAAHDPGADKVQLLGKLVIDSGFVTSKFGDHQLFFQHTFFNNEVNMLYQANQGGRASEWGDATWWKNEKGQLFQKNAGHAMYDALLPRF